MKRKKHPDQLSLPLLLPGVRVRLLRRGGLEGQIVGDRPSGNLTILYYDDRGRGFLSDERPADLEYLGEG